MANTLPANMDFIPETFAAYVDGQMYKKSNFLNSGAVFSADIQLPYGLTVTLPEFDALSGADEVKTANAPTTSNLTGSANVAAILNRVKKFGSNDLTQYLTGADPFRSIGDKFADYWAARLDEVAIASALGAAAGIDADVGAGSVIYDISGGSGSAAVISAGAIIDTQALMGEYAEDLEFMVVHPKTLAALRKANLVTNVPDATGTRMFPFYGDLRVVVSSTAGLDAGSGVYNTLIVGRNALAYADGTNPLHVLEMDREIGFADIVASSRRYVMHPVGAKFKATPAAIGGASNAELAAAASWELGTNLNAFKIRVLTHKIA